MANRVHVNLRIAPGAVQWRDDLAAKHGVSASEVLRTALMVAAKHQQELDVALEKLTKEEW